MPFASESSWALSPGNMEMCLAWLCCLPMRPMAVKVEILWTPSLLPKGDTEQRREADGVSRWSQPQLGSATLPALLCWTSHPAVGAPRTRPGRELPDIRDTKVSAHVHHGNSEPSRSQGQPGCLCLSLCGPVYTCASVRVRFAGRGRSVSRRLQRQPWPHLEDSVSTCRRAGVLDCGQQKALMVSKQWS